jgi:uncharacterized protein (TIGR02117 family)
MEYVAFGWGDKGFYLNTPNWSDLKTSTAFNAAFGLGGSAMHVSFYKKDDIAPGSIKISISKIQYFKLVEYIHHSFTKDKNGNYILIPTNMVYGLNDAFYEAVGSYSMINTCNSWTNSGLKSCEQRACFWTAFDKGIFYQYKK